ncbi:hypothetical protein R4K48_08355, partial [Brachyspira pulli]
IDSSSEAELSEEEKEMYNSYLNTSSSDTSVEEPKEEVSQQPSELSTEESVANITDKELEDLVEIKDSDLNILENIMKGQNDDDDGEELMHIDNVLNKENINNEEETKVKSVENFDSMEELLNKETNMSEEKELETIEKENLDGNVAVEDEFKLGDDDDDEPILIEEENKIPDDDDFDGEITQSDLDYAIKLFESEESNGNTNEFSSKQDILLSESEANKFKKLFGYFKNIVEKMSPEDLGDFSKTEFYDMYSSLFRKFGD